MGWGRFLFTLSYSLYESNFFGVLGNGWVSGLDTPYTRRRYNKNARRISFTGIEKKVISNMV
jgi:hypothetical protein